mgnify:CR=1 FL=1
MSTIAATRSKTYDIVYIAVFAVIMAICSWISMYLSSFCGIMVSAYKIQHCFSYFKNIVASVGILAKRLEGKCQKAVHFA